MSRVIGNKTAGCPFCTIAELSAFNERIFEMEKPAIIVVDVATQLAIDVTEPEIKAHRKHLTRIEFDIDGLFEEKELLADDASNIDVVKARMVRVRAILLEMEKDTEWVAGKHYAALLGQFTRLMELKAKLEGQIINKSETVITAKEILDKLREPADLT